LGERMMAAGATPRQRIAAGFELAISRRPDEEELALLVDAYDRFLKQFQVDPGSASELIQIGDRPPGGVWDTLELAACLSVGNVLINLDEFVVVE
jgi:hypothetical protein